MDSTTEDQWYYRR